MSIYERIQNDQIQALKAGEKETLSVLRYIVAQLKYVQIEKKQDLTDDDVVAVLRKQLKEVKESRDGFEKGGRADLVDEQKKKQEIIAQYLPAEMSDDQLKQEIQAIIDANTETFETKPKAIIGLCMKELKAKVDPSRVTRMLTEEFGV